MEICTLSAMVTLMIEPLTTRLTQNLAKWMEAIMNRFAMYRCLNPPERPRIEKLMYLVEGCLKHARVMG